MASISDSAQTYDQSAQRIIATGRQIHLNLFLRIIHAIQCLKWCIKLNGSYLDAPVLARPRIIWWSLPSFCLRYWRVILLSLSTHSIAMELGCFAFHIFRQSVLSNLHVDLIWFCDPRFPHASGLRNHSTQVNRCNLRHTHLNMRRSSFFTFVLSLWLTFLIRNVGIFLIYSLTLILFAHSVVKYPIPLWVLPLSWSIRVLPMVINPIPDQMMSSIASALSPDDQKCSKCASKVFV